jgi:hypothetical protein
MIIKSSRFNSHYLLVRCLLVIVLIEYSNGGNGKSRIHSTSSIILNLFFPSLSFFFLLRPLATTTGFLIIPKKVEQANQTKIFDRDKPMTNGGNFTVPNSISDSNKNSNSFKSIKNTITNNSTISVTLMNNNATNNVSSNQLNDTELITYFSTTNFTNITSQVGSIVEIPCTVHHLGEGTVSKVIEKIYCSPCRPPQRFVPDIGCLLWKMEKRVNALGTLGSFNKLYLKFLFIEFMSIFPVDICSRESEA